LDRKRFEAFVVSGRGGEGEEGQEGLKIVD
jgi:hypothetical protein